MIVKLLTEQHLEFLSLKGGCRGLSESTHVKMPLCWKSCVKAQMLEKCYCEIGHYSNHHRSSDKNYFTLVTKE